MSAGFPVQGRFALKGAEFLLFQATGCIALVFGCGVVSAFALGAGQSDDFLWHTRYLSITRPAVAQARAGEQFDCCR